MKSKILTPYTFNLKPNFGYILVEAAVAITIILVGLLGIFALLSRSLSLNRVVSDRYVATYLAAEGIEVVKNIIDGNIIEGQPFNTGLSPGNFEVDFDDFALTTNLNRRLKFDPDKNLYNYDFGNNTPFVRIVSIDFLADGEELRVISTVSWISRGDAQFSVELEDRFFNWR